MSKTKICKLAILLMATLWMILIGLNLNGDINVSWIWLLFPLWLFPGVLLVAALCNVLIDGISDGIKKKITDKKQIGKHLEEGE